MEIGPLKIMRDATVWKVSVNQTTGPAEWKVFVYKCIFFKELICFILLKK